LDIYFCKTAPNNWQWYAFANGQRLTPDGTLQFDTNGALMSGGTTQLTLPSFANGSVDSQPLTINFGTGTAEGGTGLDGLTQFASASNVSNRSQDGYASGDLSGVSIDSAGTVMGVYTNGQKLSVGQLAVAKFRSNEGLARAGKDQWVETRDSGSAAIGTAGSGGRGSVTSGSLEQANVDLANEFVGLIQHQRSFSANSKTITTADEMLQELINIKR
jgi:flagellar hook protein FlgE